MSPAVQTVVLDVEGMKCGGCVRAVERTLLEQPGVQRADVNLVSRAAWLDLSEADGDVDAAEGRKVVVARRVALSLICCAIAALALSLISRFIAGRRVALHAPRAGAHVV